MATKPKSKKFLCPKKSSPDAALHDGDAAALARFCSNLPHADMPFESWQTAFHDLDLQIPLWMSAQDAEQGCLQIVRFCRSVQAPGAERAERLTTCHEVVVPPGSRDGDRLVIAGQGDCSPAGRGDLVVLFRVKARV